MRNLRRGLLVGVLQQLRIDVSARCPHAERYDESASKPGWLRLLGKRRRRSAMVRPCDRWSSRLLEDWAACSKLLRDLVATAAANCQCTPRAVGRWRTQLERVLLTA